MATISEKLKEALTDKKKKEDEYFVYRDKKENLLKERDGVLQQISSLGLDSFNREEIIEPNVTEKS